VAMSPPPAPPNGMVMLAAAIPQPAVDTRRAFSADVLRAQLLDRLAPEKTVLARAMVRVAAPAGTWTRPDPLAPATFAPRFPEPMFDGLQRMAPWLFLPGVENVEADGVALLETTPRVIEAYMAGLNHELSRELLWREFPAALTGTAFRQFWDVSGQPGDAESLADIPPLAEWAGTPLGGHVRGGSGQLVLLVRGELLRRYPATSVYAAPATASGDFDPAGALMPIFRGSIDPDVTFLGFDLSQEAALGTDPAGRGWFFVFEQPAGEPRFGLDEELANGTASTPGDLAWPNVPLTGAGFVDVARPLVDATAALQTAWGSEAASMALLTLQQPFRVAIQAALILGVEEQG
jgi:hypothetical protein